MVSCMAKESRAAGSPPRPDETPASFSPLSRCHSTPLSRSVGSFATVRVCNNQAGDQASRFLGGAETLMQCPPQKTVPGTPLPRSLYPDAGVRFLMGRPPRIQTPQFAVKIVKLSGQASTRVLSSRMVRGGGLCFCSFLPAAAPS